MIRRSDTTRKMLCFGLVFLASPSKPEIYVIVFTFTTKYILSAFGFAIACCVVTNGAPFSPRVMQREMYYSIILHLFSPSALKMYL
jgi:hypothetical protein